MKISKIFCFIVTPQKKEKILKDIIGKEIITDEPIYNVVNEIIKDVDVKCDIPIKFISVNGTQKNEVLINLRTLNDSFSIDNANYFAKRLASYTDKTMKNGLLFIVKGTEDNNDRIVLFRIPAETGITIKNIEKNNFQCDISDDVFIKNSHKFKIAYFDKSENFLTGNATDKQVTQDKKIRYISDYWVKNFLNCELSITPKRGTRMLAEAVRKTIEITENETVKKELASVVTMIPNINNKVTSFEGFFSMMNLSEETKNEVLNKLTINPTVQFQIDSEEFNSNCTYRVVIIDNGAIAIAPSKQFDSIWNIKTAEDKTTVIKSTGKIVRTKYKQRV